MTKDCEVREFCHGGCSFEAVNAFQDMYHRYPNCQERKELIHYLKTTGIALLREQLVEQKRKRRKRIKLHQQLLEEISYEK